MKFIKTLFIVCLFLSISIPTWAMPATVSYIVDGDTFAAKVNLQDDIKITVRVRIINIDTPELHGMCDSEIRMANTAKNRLEQLIPKGSEIELSEVKDDKYLGRIDARVSDLSGTDVGQVLIDEKLARPYSGGKRKSWCNENL